jgi:carbon-monoxide dehydrogenase catalytic subunit
MKVEERSIDKASQEMLKKAAEEKINLAWDRLEEMQPQCGFGSLGICCTNCNMGPCRIDPFGEGPRVGVCGAGVDTIAARNLLRHIAAGAAAHSDHGRDVTHTLFLLAKGEVHDYKVQDAQKLLDVARYLRIEVANKQQSQILKEVAEKALHEFGQQEGYLTFINRAPEKRQKIWQELGVIPRGVDREIVEAMHRVHMGVDADYKNIIMHGLRVSLSDGWGGSMFATEFQDILFRTPEPIIGKINLGVLKEDMVNIVVHGHEPVLSEQAVKASQDPELIELAKKYGAKGINLAGICCTANEILMRHGIPVAGNFLQQELAVLTGAVEVLMVDVQCIMPALKDVASCFHTKIITTSPKAKYPGVEYIEFKEKEAYQIAKEIIRIGVKNYKNRKKERVCIPKQATDLIAGFTAEIVPKILGGTYRSTYRPLNDAIISGRIRGLAGVVGCNNPKITHDWAHITMVKELIKNDVLVLQTGCSALASAKQGLMKPEAIYQYAGKGLREVCEAVGIPPVLHLGSCVDNSRILIAACKVLEEGGLGEDISDLPAAGAAPEWMSEKAISIGFYFVASGVFTVLGKPFPIMGSKNIEKFLCQDLEGIVGGKFAFEEDPIKAAELMIRHIDFKRNALKLSPVMYEEKVESLREL